MKHTMFRTLSLLLVVILAFTLTACGSSKGNDLTGTTWALSGGSQDGSTVDKATLETILGGEMTFTFEEDNKVTMTMAGNEAEGTWSQDGDTVSLDAQGSTIDMTIDGDKLLWEDSGITVEFTKK